VTDEPLASRDVQVVTAGRLASNVGVRLWGPLVPQLAAGFGTSTAAIGAALSAGEFAGLLAPVIGVRVDRSRPSQVMVGALALLSVGALVIAAAPTVVVVGAALVLVSSSKVLYDTAMGSWIAAQVRYERRARVVGLTETSWALSLLVIVPLLLLIGAASSWRWAVVGVAVVNVTAALLVRSLLAGTATAPGAVRVRGQVRSVLGAWPLFAGVALLMTSSQFLFVTFSSWLEDDHGFAAAGVSAVSFLIGGVELVASSATMVLTDRIGKQVSAALGMACMVPGALALTLGSGHLGLGVVALAVFIVGFEFALVSTLPMVTEVRPEARGASLGVTIGMGTLGRGLATLAATAGYDRWGMTAPSLGALVTTGAAGGMYFAGRHRHGLR
jgi:predicted MFS family arabinose efflux permease